jgi:predicted GIY-YIG superfamily endonuclease
MAELVSRSLARRRKGVFALKFVYIIQSRQHSNQYYTGITDNVENRLAEHNAGKSQHTAKFKPWQLISYTAFLDESKAYQFEQYLKSGSGRAFSNKHFR